MSAGREPSLGELAEDIGEVKVMVQALVEKLDQLYVRRDVYEARHTALRDQVKLELQQTDAAIISLRRNTEAAAATLRQTIIDEAASIRAHADSARALALWAFGIFAVAVIGAFVTFLSSSGTP